VRGAGRPARHAELDLGIGAAELIAVEVAGGLPAYLDWVAAGVAADTD